MMPWLLLKRSVFLCFFLKEGRWRKYRFLLSVKNDKVECSILPFFKWWKFYCIYETLLLKMSPGEKNIQKLQQQVTLLDDCHMCRNEKVIYFIFHFYVIVFIVWKDIFLTKIFRTKKIGETLRSPLKNCVDD